jgi:hypothetical protein
MSTFMSTVRKGASAPARVILRIFKAGGDGVRSHGVVGAPGERGDAPSFPFLVLNASIFFCRCAFNLVFSS